MKVNGSFIIFFKAIVQSFFNVLKYFASSSLEIEKQIQQLQAQRSNLPKVDIGEKVRSFCISHRPDKVMPRHDSTHFSF